MLEKFLVEITDNPGLGVLGMALVAVAAFYLIRSLLRRGETWLAVAPAGIAVHRWFRDRPETVLLVVGALCLMVAGAALLRSGRLLSEGKSAIGEVVALAEESRHDASSNRSVTRVTATIRFQDRSRIVHVRRSWDRDGGWCIAGCYSKGERMKILYDPQDPDVYMVDTPFGLYGPTIITGTVGAIFLLAWWLTRARRRAADPSISGPAVL